MKNKNLCAVLALEQIDFHSNILPGSKPVAKFNEDQLQKIEAALEERDNTALNEKIEDQATTIANHVSADTAVTAAIVAAFEANGLELAEGTPAVDAIATLSAKCKEHGEATNTHYFVKTDGKDKQENQEPEYEFEKVLYDNSKFNTLQ